MIDLSNVILVGAKKTL